MNIDINNVTPTMIVLGIVVFAVVYYLSYTLITKDMKEEDVDYKYQLYSDDSKFNNKCWCCIQLTKHINQKIMKD